MVIARKKAKAKTAPKKKAPKKKAPKKKAATKPAAKADNELTWATKRAVAQAMNCSLTTINNWTRQGMPGTNGNYSQPEIIQWARVNIWEKEAVRTAGKKGDVSLRSEQLEAKNQALRQKMRMEEIRYAEMIGELVPVRLMTGFWDRMSDCVRRAGELIKKMHADCPKCGTLVPFGEDAHRAIDEQLVLFRDEFDKMTSEGKSSK